MCDIIQKNIENELKQHSKESGRQASRQAGKQASRQAGKQACKQAGKHLGDIKSKPGPGGAC